MALHTTILFLIGNENEEAIFGGFGGILGSSSRTEFRVFLSNLVGFILDCSIASITTL